MRKDKFSFFPIVLSLLFLTFLSCKKETVVHYSVKKATASGASIPKVTMIELGSVNCVPCKKMQGVMKKIEKNYGRQIQVVFYDVWKANQKKFAQMFHIRVIPTQIFLDQNGHEFARHEGFYPEEEINKLLAKHGLKINGRNTH